MLDPLDNQYTLPYLNSEASNPDQGLQNGRYFHGVKNFSDVISVLEDGAVKSPKREVYSDMENPAVPVIEDILRLQDIGYQGREKSLVGVLNEYEDQFLAHGSPETQEILSNEEKKESLIFMAEELNVAEVDISGRAQGDWRNYAVSVSADKDTPARYARESKHSDESAFLEFTLPENSVYLGEEVPGIIPLEYATAVYFRPSIAGSKRQKIREHPAIRNHGLEIKEHK